MSFRYKFQPRNNKSKTVLNIQEAIVVDDATCTMPKIYVLLKCVNFQNQAINATSKITPILRFLDSISYELSALV
jgi:hypothetical protein